MELKTAAAMKPVERTDLYTIDASNLDIKYVLDLLARQSGANIVVSPDVTGEINAHIKQESVESILSYLSSAQGFKWEKQANTYVVTKKDKAEPQQQNVVEQKPDEPETLIWECKNIKPQETITMLSKLYPTLAMSIAPNLVTPELSSSSSSTGTSATSGVSQTQSSSNNSSKVIIIGKKADLETVKGILTQLDVPRRQVMMEVAITEINSSASKELGIDWTWTDYTLNETPASGIGFGKFNKTDMTINAAISALIKDNKANILAQPNISVVDGENAEILIGDKILFPKLVGYSDNGAPIYDKEEEKVGIYLQIAPKIGSNDDVIMTLYPQVSLITSYLTTAAGDYPQISTREARTTVSIKSGNTLAIGGLIRENDVADVSKLPLLGDIPVIGQFFRHEKKTKERTEIVILLTPRIVEDK